MTTSIVALVLVAVGLAVAYALFTGRKISLRDLPIAVVLIALMVLVVLLLAVT